MSIDTARTAVLAIHLQNDIIHPDGTFGPHFAAEAAQRGVVAKANTIATAARAAGVPVLHARTGWDPGHGSLVANSPLLKIVAEAGCLVNGTWQTQFVSEIVPADGDIVLTTERISVFAGSPLDTILRGRAVDALVLFGVATNVAVESTARAASDLGYRVILVEDASSAATRAAHDAAVESLRLLAEVVTTDELVALLG